MKHFLGAGNSQTPLTLLYYSIILMSQTNARQGGVSNFPTGSGEGGGTSFSLEREGGARNFFGHVNNERSLIIINHYFQIPVRPSALYSGLGMDAR